jgi:Flp pilus assembly protein TadG
MNSMRRKQGGVAAVELAAILPLIILLLAFPLFFARMFMHYSVAQKAAHDGALYMANIALVEMMNEGRLADAGVVATALIRAELDELRPGRGHSTYVRVDCDGWTCGQNTAPTFVTVQVHMTMTDDIFSYFTLGAVGRNGIMVKAQATARYVGN